MNSVERRKALPIAEGAVLEVWSAADRFVSADCACASRCSRRLSLPESSTSLGDPDEAPCSSCLSSAAMARAALHEPGAPFLTPPESRAHHSFRSDGCQGWAELGYPLEKLVYFTSSTNGPGPIPATGAPAGRARAAASARADSMTGAVSPPTVALLPEPGLFHHGLYSARHAPGLFGTTQQGFGPAGAAAPAGAASRCRPRAARSTAPVWSAAH